MLPAVISKSNNKKTMPDLKDYFTTQEAADVLGFTIQGVGKLIRNKKLSAIRVGKMYLVSKVSVKEYQQITSGINKNDPTRGKEDK